MEKNIFRREALDKLSRPEQIDEMVRVTGPLGWLALLAVALLLVTAIVWGIVGSIATTVAGSGVIVRQGGYRAVATVHAGQLIEFTTAIGDTVSAGQVVAKVRQYAPEYTPYLEQRVESPFSGRVVEVVAVNGDILKPGTTILTLEPLEEPLQAVVFVPLKQAKKVMPGMAVRLIPSNSLQEEYGYLRGTVATIGDFAATRAGMMYVLNNDGLVDSLSAEGPVVKMVIDLFPDPHTASGYKWSSVAGPPTSILSGTFCLANVTVREDAPIRLVIPKLQSATGLYR